MTKGTSPFLRGHKKEKNVHQWSTRLRLVNRFFVLGSLTRSRGMWLNHATTLLSTLEKKTVDGVGVAV